MEQEIRNCPACGRAMMRVADCWECTNLMCDYIEEIEKGENHETHLSENRVVSKNQQ